MFIGKNIPTHICREELYGQTPSGWVATARGQRSVKVGLQPTLSTSVICVLEWENDELRHLGGKAELSKTIHNIDVLKVFLKSQKKLHLGGENVNCFLEQKTRVELRNRTHTHKVFVG